MKSIGTAASSTIAVANTSGRAHSVEASSSVRAIDVPVRSRRRRMKCVGEDDAVVDDDAEGDHQARRAPSR